MSLASTHRSSSSEGTELTDAEQKVHRITNDAGDAATSEQMRAISTMTHDSQSCGEVAEFLLTRLITQHDSWRSNLKCLQLLEYLLRTGSEHFVNYFRACPDVLATFTEYLADDNNIPVVRAKAEDVCHLLAGGAVGNGPEEHLTDFTIAQGSTNTDRSSTRYTSDEAYYRASLTVPDISAELSPLPLHPAKSSGFADIYLCDWVGAPHRRQVGVKVIRASEMQMTPSLSRTILREIEVWHRAKHPNIHPLLGLYWGRGQLPAMVSPWCRNGDIPQYLRSMRNEPDLDNLKLRLMQQVVSGLKYLHHSQPPVVHGDIKGANVLVSDSGIACLCDFGLATVKADRSSSPAETLKGTVRWMAPELFDTSSKGYTTHSDIWAIGCLILEIQSERMPYFDRERPQAVVLALGQNETPSRPIGVPDRLWWFMHECWAANAVDRPSVDTVAERLQGISEVLSRAPHRWHEPCLPAAPHEFPVKTALGVLNTSTKQKAASPRYFDDLLLQAVFVLVTSDVGRELLGETTFTAAWVASALSTCVQRAVEREHDSLIVPVTQAVIAYVRSSPSIDKKGLKELLKASQRPAREIRRLATPVAKASIADAEWIMACLSCRVAGRVESENTEPFTCVAFVPQKRALVTGSCNGAVCVYDFVLGSLCLGPLGAGGTVTCLTVSGAQQRIASGTSNGNIRLWELDTGRDIFGDLVGHTLPITYLCFSGNGMHIASRSEKDGAICIWDVRSGTLLVGPFHHDPDNRPLYNLPPPVSFSDKEGVILLALYPGNMQSIFQYRACEPVAQSRDIATNGKRPGATAQWLGKARGLWTSGVRRKGAQPMAGSIRHVRDVRAELHIPWSVLEFHSASYTPPGLNPYPLPQAQPRSRSGEIILSPSGQVLAVVNEHDETIAVWDANTMMRVTAPLGKFGGYMTFSPDSKYLSAIGAHPEDGVTVWDLTDQWRQVL